MSFIQLRRCFYDVNIAGLTGEALFFYTLSAAENEKNFSGGAFFSQPAVSVTHKQSLCRAKLVKGRPRCEPGLCAAACESVRVFIIFLLFIVTLMLTSSPLFSVKTL